MNKYYYVTGNLNDLKELGVILNDLGYKNTKPLDEKSLGVAIDTTMKDYEYFWLTKKEAEWDEHFKLPKGKDKLLFKINRITK